MPDDSTPPEATSAAPVRSAGAAPSAPSASTGMLELQLALALEMGRFATWRLDLDSGLVHLNAQAASILGLAPGNGGRSLAEMRSLVHPDDLDRLSQVNPEPAAEDAAREDELRFRGPDGNWHHALMRRIAQRDASGHRVAVLGVMVDITERRQAELALRSAAERAALAARGAGVGTWEIDVDTGVAQWDEQMWLLRGLAPQPRAMSPMERLAIVHPEDRMTMAEGLRVAMEHSHAQYLEFRVIWPDGQVRWLASRSSALRDPVSGHGRRIGINWDITDSRTANAVRQERALARLESQAKSRFLSRMSHELRTPLNAVLGFSQLLLAEDGGADAAAALRRRRLSQVHAAGEHLLSLIDDVLDLANLESGEMRIELQAVELLPLVRETLPVLEPQRRISAGIALHLGALEGAVVADPKRLRQVLINLLSNAIKYNRPGGEVWLEAVPDGEHLRLRVTDSGQGMAPEQMSHLYEPFNRLGAEQRAVGGTGVGLSIVKALVERMCGSVMARSVLGKGSVFEVVLPRADAPAVSLSDGPAGPDHVPVQGAPIRPRPLLYIEDNAVNALIVTELLAGRKDIAVHVAVDGTSGVEQAGLLLPELILLDMQLPDFDGLEVLRRLRARPATAAIPCIALSANAMPDYIQNAMSAGLADYWTKPLDFGAFMASIDRLFGHAPRGAPPA